MTEHDTLYFELLCLGGLAFCCTGFYGLSIKNPQEQSNALSVNHVLKIPALVLLSSLAMITTGYGIKKCFSSIGKGVMTIGTAALSASVGWFTGIAGFIALGVYIFQNQNSNSVSDDAFLGTILGIETLFFLLLMLKGLDIENTRAVTNVTQQANLLTPTGRPRSPALLAAPPSPPALPSSQVDHTSIEMMPRTETRFTA